MITSPNIVGVTQSQQQQNGLDRLNQSMQQFAANKLEKQRNAVALLNQVLSGPYRGAVLANKDMALGLFSTMSDALGTRDPNAILQFVQGNANTPLTPEEQQGLTQYLYASGAIQGQESATQAPDDLARLRTLWTKPQAPAPAPDLASADTRAATPVAKSPSQIPAPAAKVDTPHKYTVITPDASMGVGSMQGVTIQDDTTGDVVRNADGSPMVFGRTDEAEAYKAKLMTAQPSAAPSRAAAEVAFWEDYLTQTESRSPEQLRTARIKLAEAKAAYADERALGPRPSTGVGAGTASPAPASSTPAAPAGKSPASTPAPAPGVQVNGYSFESAKQKLAAANPGNAAVMDALGKAQTFADLAVIAPNGYKAYINPDGTAPDQITLPWAKKQAASAPAVAVSASGSQSAAGPSTTPQSAEFQAASADDQLAARYLGGDTTLTDRDKKQAEYYISQIHNRGQKSLRATFSSTGAKQWDSTVLQTAANYLNIGQPENGGIKDNPALSALFIDKPGIEKKKAEAQIALDFAQAEEAVKNAGYLDAKTQGYGVELGIEAAKLTMQQAMANSVDFAKAVDLFKMEAEPWLAGLTEVRKALAKDPFNKDLKNREQEYLRMMQESPNWQNIQKAITFIESRTMNVPTTLGLDFIKKYGFFSTKVNGEYTFPLLDFTGLGMGTSTGADNVTGSGGAAGEAAAAGLPDVYE